MLYNCGMIFFILSFFVGYILSFGLVRLRTIRLSARVGAHIERRCSRSRGEDVTITDVIIKTRIENVTGDVNDVMPVSDGLRILGDFWKKELVEIWSWTKRVNFWTWARPVQLWTTGCPRLVGSDGTVSIVKIVSFSPRVENLKVKKVIKVSYLNYRESSVFRVFFGFLCRCMWTFYVSEYFTYSYLAILHFVDEKKKMYLKSNNPLLP